MLKFPLRKNSYFWELRWIYPTSSRDEIYKREIIHSYRIDQEPLKVSKTLIKITHAEILKKKKHNQKNSETAAKL